MFNILKNPLKPAVLALSDGSFFLGYSFGAEGYCVGEVVFNTAITGYQEILTDPSYTDQLVTLTYPHIGNVGVNSHDAESTRVHVKGLIIRELSPIVSNWRAECCLSDYLKQHNTIGITGIDTRRLTRFLRDNGSQSGCIMTGTHDPAEAMAKAQSFMGLEGKDLTSAVTCQKIAPWKESLFNLDQNAFDKEIKPHFYHVVVVDFGVKRHILQYLVDRGCAVTVVPANTSPEAILALHPTGILLSNGPGDPAACVEIIENIKHLVDMPIPIFGICLGFQLLALALGANTFKMKFGHHGANHPVEDLQTKKVFITSQNHGFAVEESSLPAVLRITHRSLFDKTIQGFVHTQKSIMAFQGHPEAGPGPQDIQYLFDTFVGYCEAFTSLEKVA